MQEVSRREILECDLQNTLVGLRAWARSLGLPVSGDKATLCRRVLGAGVREKVVLPESARKALYGLQEEPTGYQWGGGVDFEIVHGRPQVERILAYLGEEGKIPWRVLQKYGYDVEVRFHTHPRQYKAIPSIDNLYAFIIGNQQVEFVVAGGEILILEKTPEVVPEVSAKLISEALSEFGDLYDPGLQDKELKAIRDRLKLKTTLVPRADNVSFDLTIVRRLQKQ